MVMIGHQRPGVNVCLGFQRLYAHTGNKILVVFSSFTILPLSRPMIITWCIVPGASNLGPRGILTHIYVKYQFNLELFIHYCIFRPSDRPTSVILNVFSFKRRDTPHVSRFHEKISRSKQTGGP
jgi:hypothetical protein